LLTRERKGGVVGIGIMLHQDSGAASKLPAETDSLIGPSRSGI